MWRDAGLKHIPFFVHPDVGIGKTHVIKGIGNAIRAKLPGMRVGYVSGSRIASRVGEAAREKAVEFFRDDYCQWDVSSLGDRQSLGGRIQAQEDFLHIINVLQQEQRQIIIAGD